MTTTPPIGTAFARPHDRRAEERRRDITAALATIPNPKVWMLCFIEGCLRYRLDDADAVAKIEEVMSIYNDLMERKLLRG
jgi:hypothetical protein